MAEIPLRSYLHEIEKHIESGRTDQAISHSRYLLQIYPKYVDAYRLLGKSFLESQRYTDAGDIFQRVLSAVPDDFVSQVGMSIIREDEGNLDEAIWHMERAFEVQPSNNAIQEELGRLYAKRDNIDPPKIRLTRGALARLYYKGELYQQAVSEIRSALAENTSRIDLQALLADIYLKINQRVEAADTALTVLHHLPNCMVAIQVMIQVLEGADREDELKNYRQRLAQLDPYTAFTSLEHPNVEDVQDNAVQVEKLDWKPDQVAADTSTPAWAASLGVDLADLAPSAESTLPDWLDDLAAQPDQAPAGVEETSSAFAYSEIVAESAAEAPPEPQQEEDIPDWLREAGWQAPSAKDMTRELRSDVVESEVPALEGLDEGIIERDDQLAEAEIPDWLQALKPEEQVEAASPAAEPETAAEELAPWLDKIIPAEPAVQIETPDVIEIGPSTEDQAEPDWLKAASLGAAGAAALAGAEEPPIEETPPEAAAEPLLSWLQESEAPAGETPVFESETAPDLPDWVTEPAAEEPQPVEPAEDLLFETEAALPAELPDWLLEAKEQAAEAAAVEPELEGILTPEAEAELPAWLREAEEPVAEAAAAELPDWLREAEEPVAEAAAAEPELEGILTPQAETELPDWLREAEEPVAEAAAAEPELEGILTPETELPDWLREPEEPVAEAAAAEPELEGILTPQAETELPDWLREAEEPVAEAAAVEPELESVMAPEEKIELPEWDIDSAFPTAVGGAERAGLEAKDRFDEEAGVEIPSWLQSAQFAAAEESGAKAEPAADLPDWLTGRQLESLEGPSIFETEGPPGAYESALPDWLMESSPKTPEPGALEPESAELPSWLLETETEFALEGTSGEAEPPADIEAEIELPAWLVEPEETVHVPEAGEEIQEVEMEQFETPEPVLPEEGEAPVEPVETMPEKEKPLEEAFAWLMGLGAQAEVTAAPEAPEAPVEPVEELVETGWQAEEEIASFEAPAEAAFVEEVILVDEPAGEDLPLPEALFVEEEAPVEEPAGEPSLPAFSEALGEELIDQDAAFAWLESLAIKQGASEALLLTPEERSESMPEWVKQDALAAEAALEEPSTEEAEPLEETEAQLSAPEELVEAPALEEAAPAADYGLEFEIEREGIGEEAEPLFEAVEEAEPAFEAVEEAEQFEAAFEPVEEAEPLEAVEEAEIEIETEAVLEPEAPPAEEEIPELPSWLAETAPAPHEEFDWSPPPFPPRSVDLNRASLSDLERLPGVGFIAAQAILNHRDQHGPFQSVDDLALVPEIGPEALAAARDYLFVEAPEPLAPAAEPAPPPAEVELAPFQPSEAVSGDLEAARLTLAQGGLEQALAQYEALILSNRDLQPVAQDLQQAAERFPNDLRLWQALGDAYLRLDKVQEALEAYVKAEQLLH